MVLLACLGLAFSAILSVASFSGDTIAGCEGGWFDCSSVLSSRWSSIGPVPVSVLATGAYAGILMSMGVACAASTVLLRRAAWFAVAAGSMTVAIAAIWFIALQVWVVQHLCVYCLLVHACSLCLGSLILAKWGSRRAETHAALAVGVLAVSSLAVVQWVAAPRPTFTIERLPQRTTEPQTIEAPIESSVSPALFEAPTSPGNLRIGVGKASVLGDAWQLTKVRGKSPDRPIRWQSMLPSANAAALRFATLAVACSIQAEDCEAFAGKPPTPSTEPQELQRARPIGAGDQESSASDASNDRVVEFGQSFRLNARHWPVVGDVEAPDLIVEMFDYTCPYCRANHQWVREAVRDSKSTLAVVALAVPMQQDCNPTVTSTDPTHRDACRLAELSVAVWLAEPEQFTRFHEWLFEGSAAPTARDAEREAASLVGAEKLQETLATGTPRRYVTRQVELYQVVGAGKVPKLLFSDSIVTGDIGSSARLRDMLRSQAARPAPRRK